jgi:hypothetical protein
MLYTIIIIIIIIIIISIIITAALKTFTFSVLHWFSNNTVYLLQH